MQKEDAKALQI